MSKSRNNGIDLTQATVTEIKPSGLIREYRIVMPLTTDEYHIAQLYGVAEASKNETGGGDGVEVRENRPLTDDELNKLPFKDRLKPREDGTIGGQYTYKIMHLSSKVPSFVRAIAPTGSLEVHEKAWNCFPYCRTEWINTYMGDTFHLIIESMHQDDNGSDQNAHKLNQADLIKRKVVNIDIASKPSEYKAEGDYKEEEDPAKFHSEKTGRGPLGEGWIKTQTPVMCCYKLYRILFKWRGLQTRVQDMIANSFVPRLLFNVHRQIFCWIDKWFGMTMDDIRLLEDKTKADLEKMRQEGEVRGTSQA